MDEPSVLDYVKAKLTFWKKSTLYIPDLDEVPADWSADAQTDEAEAGLDGSEGLDVGAWMVRIPWLAYLPLLLVLFAQLMLEPPVRFEVPALALYLIAAVLISLAVWKKEIQLSDSKADSLTADALKADRQPEDLRAAWMVSVGGVVLGLLFFLVKTRAPEANLLMDFVRGLLATLTGVAGFWAAWLGGKSLTLAENDGSSLRRDRQVLLALFLFVTAFLLLGENRFNALNLLIWFGCMGISAGLVFRFELRDQWTRLQGVVTRPLVMRVGLFAVLLAAVVLVVAYFRFSDLIGLPGEMFSDHAEKLYDVNDLINGQYKMFFERNTGREMFQFYWTALMAAVFGTGISFMSLKIGTVLVGLITLYYIYRLGDELGGKWVALYALFFAGIAYWPNIISRIGLRFPLYPFCVAPVMFYLLRGLRRETRNDFVWAGIWLGIGLHGYTASRIVPLLVLAAFGLYALHVRPKGSWMKTLTWLMILVFVSLVIFLPLYRYALDTPEMFAYRSLTRLGTVERPLPGSPIAIFLSNFWNAIVMFFYDNGDVWVHSIPHRPALALVDAGLFFYGAVLVLARYIRRFHWRDLFLLLSIPILLLPSILSLAFPNENPNLNRTAGAYVPVFIVIGLGFDALLTALRRKVEGRTGLVAAGAVAGILMLFSLALNGDLFFNQYATEYRQSSWNTTEMGDVLRGFSEVVGTTDTSWVVGYPYWVDTRLVGINAGIVDRNPEISPLAISQKIPDPRAKLFLLNPSDSAAFDQLRLTYPFGRFWLHHSAIEGKDFLIYMVPADAELIP